MQAHHISFNHRAPYKRYIFGSLSFLALTFTADSSGLLAAEQPQPVAASQDVHALQQRGDYLVTVMGCNDCHTPLKPGPKGPELDKLRLLSGHPENVTLPPPPKLNETWNWVGSATNTAFAGPWGISYSSNLTPDKETGLGAWTEEIFIKALKTGKHIGVGRPIMPPMPWPWYAKFTDEDLKAIFAYLRTIPPVHNRVPDYSPLAGISKW